MSYSSLLKEYIKTSRYTLEEIIDLLAKKNVSLSREHLSRLQNGKASPASEELNKALAEITGGDPDELNRAAYMEKAPVSVREQLEKVIDKSNLENSLVGKYITWEQFEDLQDLRNFTAHGLLPNVSPANRFIIMDIYVTIELIISGKGDFTESDLKLKFQNLEKLLKDPTQTIDYHMGTGAFVLRKNTESQMKENRFAYVSDQESEANDKAVENSIPSNDPDVQFIMRTKEELSPEAFKKFMELTKKAKALFADEDEEE